MKFLFYILVFVPIKKLKIEGKRKKLNYKVSIIKEITLEIKSCEIIFIFIGADKPTNSMLQYYP
jgi:hypothetical protein